MLFVGTYEHRIDAKSRLAIPAPVRGKLQRILGLGEGDAIPFYVTLSETDNALAVYSEPGFEAYMERIRSPKADVDKVLRFEREVLPNTLLVETDKQGRIVLPELLLSQIDLPQDVTLKGLNDHLEIAPRQDTPGERPRPVNLRRLLPTE